MQKVLRSCLLGLLLVTGMSVSAMNEKVVKQSSSETGLATYIAISTAIWAVQKTVPNICAGVKKYGPDVVNGAVQVAKNVGLGIKVAGWDYALQPAGNFVYDNSKTSVTVPFVGFCIKNIWTEFKKKSTDTDSTKTLLNGLGIFAGVGIIAADWQAWQKIVLLKDKLLQKISKKQS